MTTADLEPALDVRRQRRHFVLRRLHSLTGVVPVGAFLVEHFYTNAKVLYGREAFNRAVGDIQSMPMLVYVELFGIVLPLAFHGLYGVVIAAQGSVNVGNYSWTRNWMYFLQRVSGVVALLFIGLHLWQYRIQKMLNLVRWEDFYHRLTIDLNRPAMFAIYMTGVTATVFHFANGLWLFGNSWGITVSEKSMRRSALACLVFGIVLWVVGADILMHFAVRCGGLIPLPEQATVCGR